MSNDVKVVLNYKEVGNLMKGKEMQGILEKHANQVAGNAGECKCYVAGTRAVVTVDKRNGKNALRALR